MAPWRPNRFATVTVIFSEPNAEMSIVHDNERGKKCGIPMYGMRYSASPTDANQSDHAWQLSVLDTVTPVALLGAPRTSKGPYIKYIQKVLGIFEPLPLVHIW